MRRPAGSAGALVLAAGDGNRLRGVTATAGGGHVPKPFCWTAACAPLSLDAAQATA